MATISFGASGFNVWADVAEGEQAARQASIVTATLRIPYSRHCERSEAIQLRFAHGLRRRCAPRNDELIQLRP
jgi:uncharacterized protein YcnI